MNLRNLQRSLVGVLALLALPAFAQEIRVVDVKASSSFFNDAQQIVATNDGLVEDPPGSGQFRFRASAYSWTSNYGTPNDEYPLIHFEFDAIRTVERFRVWNGNDPGFTWRGFRDVVIQYSNDGQRWTTIPTRFTFAQAPGTDNYFGEEFTLPFPVATRFVRFQAFTNYRAGGNPDIAALGRVKFFEGGTPGGPGPETGPYPRAAGVIDVTQPPYNAAGDGVTDDADAIQRAIRDHEGSSRIIFLPEGTYLLSRPLTFRRNSTDDRNSLFGFSNFRGAGSGKTILRLKDNTLTDANNPRAVLFNGFLSFFNGSFEETAADWFNNNFAGFTIDTGAGNPGAKGFEYFSNNTGSVRDVVIRSGDGQGAIGLDLGHQDKNGPFMIRGVRVEGFDIGIRTALTVNSATLEDIVLVGQRNVAMLNEGQCLTVYRLRVEGEAAGLRSTYGHTVIVDAVFEGTGSASGKPAIFNGEYLFARNIEVSGYALGIDNEFGNGLDVPGSVGEYVSTANVLRLFPAPPRSLNLRAPNWPELVRDAPEAWANVRDFRLTTERDDAAAFQRAIDSGATTVYFPAGLSTWLESDVIVRGNVRHVTGMFSTVRGFNNARVRVGAGTAPIVWIEEFRNAMPFDNAGQRTAAFSDIEGSVLCTGTGTVFIENMTGDFSFGRQRVYGRQVNAESEGTKIVNDGGVLWILGLKTERGGTLVDTRNGGKTEVLGGLCYTTTNGRLGPMFAVTDSTLSVSIGEVCYTFDPYTVLVRETQRGVTRELVRGQAPFRFSFMQGSDLPLFRAQVQPRPASGTRRSPR